VPGHPGLLDPAQASMRAPAEFTVRYDTTKGPITFVCHRKWAPFGADRIYALVKIGFFRDVALYRVKPGFVVQWGIHGDPAVNAAWKKATLPVDPVVATNKRGTISFAMASKPTTRSTQLFINTGDNRRLDSLGFAPVCEIESGMAVVDGLFSGHGEKVTSKQARIMAEGNAYLRREWPGLDYIASATVLGSP
jgi:peptidyl-prolyl cis-trans isomerase A (cyclophilin A)